MKTNNISLIKPLLIFDNPGDTYIIQIMTRKKDGGQDGDQNARTIKEYFVDSISYFERKLDEIIKLCEIFNARAYINLNRKNLSALAPILLSIIAEKMQQPHPNYLPLMTSAIAKCPSDRRVFLIDIDTKDPHVVDELLKVVSEHVLEVVPTPQGFHILATPFDTRDVRDINREVSVHRNNPTILYANLKS